MLEMVIHSHQMTKENKKKIITYPLTKPLRLLMGDAVVVAEFSVDNVRSIKKN